MRYGAVMAAALALVAAGGAWAQGGLLDQGRNLLLPPAANPAGRAPAVSETQAGAALREALRFATQRTVSRVGRTDGYNRDADIRIPLPGFLDSARQGLGAVGLSGILDDLQLRMNRAAETAAPKAAEIFGDAIASMTVNDARGIVSGPTDAAKRYFQRSTTEPLSRAFRPIIDRSLADVGAVQVYKETSARIAPPALGGLLGGGAGGFDLTEFVLEKALDGLFHYIAQEEAAIRSNPSARTTDLLRQVFGG